MRSFHGSHDSVPRLINNIKQSVHGTSFAQVLVLLKLFVCVQAAVGATCLGD